MSIRHHILAALAKRPTEMQTIEDLQEATGEADRKRLASNIKAAIVDGLIERLRDDVTGQPAYRLTPTGAARQKFGSIQHNGKTQAENLAKSPKPAPADQPDVQASNNETVMLSIIADIREAIGDPEGKLMLGDLANVIRDRYDAGKQYQADVERLTRKCHDLGNDVAGYAMQQSILRTKLGIRQYDDVVVAVDALLGIACQSEPAKPTGKLALLLIDSADMMDIEELDGADIDKAQAEALRNIDVGNAARAVVISIHGEAYRRTEWKEAA